ncbi:hypothetical protein UZ36_08000 [Candidatus Nitromaritima sp. SCGC AAA799-C22]|nr:hypothetical protein UZ36_08000 [Candidatus Nitromaritima sp. SCGC AAA799-C22]
MRSKYLSLNILIFSMFVTGCVSYPVVGAFENTDEIFRGTVDHNLLIGAGDINVEAERSGIQCKGTSRVTYVPPFSLSCAGQRGEAPMRCDDGRFLTVVWTADSCTSGTGNGKDDQEGKFNFVFGLSEQEAMEFINQRAQLNKSKSGATKN